MTKTLAFYCTYNPETKEIDIIDDVVFTWEETYELVSPWVWSLCKAPVEIVEIYE